VARWLSIVSGDRLIYLGTAKEVRENMGTWGVPIGKPRPGSLGGTTLEYSLFERRIRGELSGVPDDYQIYISSNKIEGGEDEGGA